MAIFSRARKHPQHGGLAPFKAGIIAIVVIGVASYFGFTKSNPFANPFELKAVFTDATNVQKRAPVRIAGVDVGKVTKIEPIGEGGGARVTMELQDKGLPIHEDAKVKIRTRIFLEGNVFIDIKPGTPSADTIERGHTIPSNQTATSVQFSEILTALESDTREDLKTLLFEYAVKGLSGGGATAFNRSIEYWESAYKNSSLANDATLGQNPTRDLQRVLSGQQRTFAALAADEESLKDLVTNFNTTAGALAREDVALEASVPALRDVLRVGRPALASLNAALPPLRRFARDALPGVRSSGPTIDASLPFIRQARRLFSRSELRGLARDLRVAIPALAQVNSDAIPLFAQLRSLSRCQNEVFLPFANDTIPEPHYPENNNQRVLNQIQRSFVGLAGESRQHDANTPIFRVQGVNPAQQTKVRPARPSDGGLTPPPHRPDVPCETQEPPDLNAPGFEAPFRDPASPLLPDVLPGDLPIDIPGDLGIPSLRVSQSSGRRAQAQEREIDRAAAKAAAEQQDGPEGERRPNSEGAER
jgi:phospholipid/cholesterol/gamma-HCH transport system substrate-binding protein